MKKILMVVAAAMTLALAGCGGGGGSSGSSAPSVPNDAAAGFWTGTTSDGRAINTVTLRDGQFYGFYEAIGNANQLAGLMQMNGSVAGTTTTATISSNDARIFVLQNNPSEVVFGTLNASMTRDTTMTATFTPSATAATVSAIYADPAFRTTPLQATPAGTYSGVVGTTTGTGSATMTITAAGAISGTAAVTCTFTGQVTPKTGVNAYDLSITLGNVAACDSIGARGATTTGLAYLQTNRLYAAALNAGRTGGFIFQGDRP